MPGVKGTSVAGDEVVDMIRLHGSATSQGVATYCDIELTTAIQRIQRLRKARLIEKYKRVGRVVIWRLRESDTQAF
jgi:hypothetical protein